MKHYMTVVSASPLQSCVAPQSTYGLRLPDGDPEAGRPAFVYLQSNC